jgi:nucleoside-diphosphate-sugar epimerase
VSWTDRGDEAEAAAMILARPGSFDGPVTLTAGAAVTFDDIAGMASELTGRDIRRVLPRYQGLGIGSRLGDGNIKITMRLSGQRL